VIKSDDDLTKRTREAFVEISNTAIESLVTDRDGNQTTALAGGTWYQNSAELECGPKAAWRNARMYHALRT
jgi:nitric oxide synthase oxygenase domain/subunit